MLLAVALNFTELKTVAIIIIDKLLIVTIIGKDQKNISYLCILHVFFSQLRKRLKFALC